MNSNHKDSNISVKKDDDFEESESTSGWISWFCELEGHDFFAEVTYYIIGD